MIRERLFRLPAPAAALALLAIVFALAAWTRFGSRGASDAGNARVLTFAHTHLEGGVREAFDQLAREFEALHPGVEVRQIAVPVRAYSSWAMTRLIGDHAPDVMQLSRVTTSPEVLARFFRPLGDAVDEPNPYNRGTPLEGLAWRDTFADGLSWPPSYSLPLFDVYGISISLSTVRMFYNRDLMIRITGEDRPPRDYADFRRLCAAVAAYRDRTGHEVIPLAGSRWNAEQLVGRMFESQTRRLALRMDRLTQLLSVTPDRMLHHYHGNVDLDTPEFRSGLKLVRELALQMPPGFLQLEREDGAFYFTQERALMIAAGVHDLGSLQAEAPFELGVFPLPFPDGNDPQFGEFSLGPDAETQGNISSSWGVTLDSPNAGLALDFLRFLTARPQVERLVALSRWLPAQVDPPLRPELEPFRPVARGFPAGLSLSSGTVRMGSLSSTGEVDLAVARHLHLLFSPSGSVETFVDALRRDYHLAYERSYEKSLRARRRTLARYDATIGSLMWKRAEATAPREGLEATMQLALDNECQWDLMTYWLEHGREPEFHRGTHDDPLFDRIGRGQPAGPSPASVAPAVRSLND